MKSLRLTNEHEAVRCRGLCEAYLERIAKTHPGCLEDQNG